MAVPEFLNCSYRYFQRASVTDVQTIINDLYTELVTNGGWTCTQGGSGQTPTTFLSPARSDGVSFNAQLTRDSATRLSWVVKDQFGLQINNQTNTKQDIDAGGTTVNLFTSPFYICVDSARATPECFACGILSHDPDTPNIPRAFYWSTQGPRATGGSLATQQWYAVFATRVSSQLYSTQNTCPYMGPITGANCFQLMTGEVRTGPWEIMDENGSLQGRIYQGLCTDALLAYGTDIVVPIDGSTTGTFRVIGLSAVGGMRAALRKA
jgi:hypothetical protein